MDSIQCLFLRIITGEINGIIFISISINNKFHGMKLYSILALIFILPGCNKKLSPDAGWGNQRWFLVEMKGVPVQQSGSRKDAYINFQVAEKRFNGNAGCNQMSGIYTVDKSVIHFDKLISTKMSCADIEFENVFLTTLAGIDKFEQRGNDLLLKNNKDIMLILRPR